MCLSICDLCMCVCLDRGAVRTVSRRAVATGTSWSSSPRLSASHHRSRHGRSHRHHVSRASSVAAAAHVVDDGDAEMVDESCDIKPPTWLLHAGALQSPTVVSYDVSTVDTKPGATHSTI